MSKIRIPLFDGRPVILFPKGWQFGWLDEINTDPNAAHSQKWSLQDWKEFRSDYYSGIMPCPFGYETSSEAPWQHIPYAPWGISNRYSEPKLHPADE